MHHSPQSKSACPSCGCRRNLPHFKWCKHCHSDLPQVQGAPVQPASGAWARGFGSAEEEVEALVRMDGKTKGGRKGLGKKGKGKGSELAAAGRGARAAALPDVPHGALPPGPVPRLSATEAKQPADLHSKAGEEQLAAKYRAIAVSLDKSERAPAPSLQQQVQSAHAAVRRKERALQVEFAKLNRWRAELEEQRKKVAELHSELGEADAAYKKVVLELQQQVPSEPAPAAAAQVTLEQLVDGSVSIDQIIST